MQKTPLMMPPTHIRDWMYDALVGLDGYKHALHPGSFVESERSDVSSEHPSCFMFDPSTLRSPMFFEVLLIIFTLIC